MELREFKASGRRVSGLAVPVGALGTIPSDSPAYARGLRRERIASVDAIEFTPTVHLNMHHETLVSVAHSGPGGGLQVEKRSDGLYLDAEIDPTPAGELALRNVRNGNFRQLSINFTPQREHVEDGIRVLDKILVDHVALVPRGAYPQTSVEARARRSGGRARVRPMPDAIRRCTCVSKATAGKCQSVAFDEDAFVEVVKLVQSGKRPMTLHTGGLDHQHVIATAAAGTLTVEIGKAGELVAEVAADRMRSEVGRQFADYIENAAPVVRPLMNDAESTFVDDEDAGVRRYSVAMVDALLVKVALTDPRGWDQFEVTPGPEGRAWRRERLKQCQ